MAHLVVTDLNKSFAGPQLKPVPALRQVSLSLASGELLVLLGPSGCGKTTFLRLLAGLEKPDSGTICLDERPIDALPPEQRDMAMVFQSQALFPHLSVFENLALGLRLRQVARQEIQARVQQAAAMLELTPLLPRLPEALSGGQRQRVAIGRALVQQPRVFLLDEPLSQLDPLLRRHLLKEIAQLQARLGTTMLYVTHDQEEALALGHRIALLEAGRLLQAGTAQELLCRPAHLRVAEFFSTPPIALWHGRLESVGGTPFFVETPPQGNGWRLSWPGRVEQGLLNRPLLLGIRPPAVRLAPAGGVSVPEQFPTAVITSQTRLGMALQLTLFTGRHSFTLVHDGWEEFSPGAKVPLQLHLSQALLFDPKTGGRVGHGGG